MLFDLMFGNYYNIYTLTLSALALFLFLFFIFCYKRCPSNKILAIYGKIRGKSFVKCYHGGGVLVWPIIQGYSFLDLTPRTIHIPLKGALSYQNIRINVPSTFTIAVDPNAETMSNAAARLLNLSAHDIELLAIEIITGQMRLIVASLTIEQINQDREKFLDAIRSHIDPELKKVGLSLINVNITDITDESNYIESIGKKAASSAVNQAKIDVSEADKRGDIGKSNAERERRVSVAKFEAEAVEGENKAKADIAVYNSQLSEKQAEADKNAQVAEQNSYADIQQAKALAELKRLEAEQIVPREIEKRKFTIDAEAIAQKRKLEAAGEAEAIIRLKQAEAEGILKILTAKAEGYRQLIEACSNDVKSVCNMLLIEKLEEIVKAQTEAIKNLKIDKITVWDSGSNEKGSTTSNFVSNLIKSLPALHDITSTAGLDLPEFLGSLKTDILDQSSVDRK